MAVSSRFWFSAPVVVGAVLAVSGCVPASSAAPVVSVPATPVAAATGAPVVPAPLPPLAPVAVSVTVASVTDGDTFVTSDGRTVRVLGIDSCEAGTYGGRLATDAAKSVLLGQPVTLTAEPGVDTDSHQRQLRYVQVRGQDFGKAMVPSMHTGVYEGRNDASPSYVAELRAVDNGRSCAAPVTSSAPPPTVNDDNDRAFVPAPAPRRDTNSGSSATKPRTGHSGHPCLPGERDGDGDGYCKEGRS